MSPRPRLLVLVAATLVASSLPAASFAVPAELTRQLDQAETRLEQLDSTMSAAVEDYNAAAAELEQLQVEHAETQERVNTLSADVETLESSTATFVRNLWIRGPKTDLSIIFDATEASAASRELTLMDRFSRQRRADLESLGARRAELDVARTMLADQVRAARIRERRLGEARQQLEEMVADEQDEIAALQDEIETIRQREAAEAAAREAAAREAAAREEAARQADADRAAAAAQAAAAAAPPAPTAAPAPPRPPAAAPPGTRQGAQTAVQAALSQLGKPYRYAAAGPDAYDCSGLTQWAWAHAGVSLPHSSRMQYASTRRVTRDQLQPGDLIFYGSPIHHVAMYVDGTRVVEAPYTGANVRIRNDGLLRRDIVGYGRP